MPRQLSQDASRTEHCRAGSGTRRNTPRNTTRSTTCSTTRSIRISKSAHDALSARLGLGALLLVFCLLVWATQVRAAPPAPSTDYSPEQVVALVVDALKSNDETAGDDGIATVFGFASPANRRMTGPLTRFTDMLKTGYGDMLNHRSSRRAAMQIEGDVALQAVWLTTAAGNEVGYMFRLGRQQSGEYAGMWMTDAVYPLERQPQGQSI